MKLEKIVLFSFVLLAAGCSSDNTMSSADIEASKHSKAPTAAQQQQMMSGMAKGATDAKAQEKAWAAAHPDKVAEVNAARVASGRPKLGE